MLLPLRDQIQPVYRSNLLSGTFLPTGSTFTAGSLAWYHDETGALRARPHNLLLNSESVSTQTVTSVVGALYTVSFYGTGSIAISGAYTGTLNGTGVNDRVSVQFTATTTSIVLTVTGTVTQGQVNRGALQPYYPTTSAAYYGPRFAYDPVTLQPLGLQLERVAGTNYAFLDTSSVYTITRAKNAVGPSGLTEAYTCTTSATTDGSRVGVTVGAIPTGSQTMSYHVKAGTLSKFQIDTGLGSGYYANFDLATKTVTRQGANATAAGIIQLPNGWFRIYVSYTTATSPTRTALRPLQTGNEIITPQLTWSAGETFYTFGEQLESGFLSSFIYTTTAAVTRTQERLYVSAPWLNSAQGTVVMNYITMGYGTSGSPAVIDINDGSINNRVQNYINETTSATSVKILSGGITSADFAVSGFGVPTANALQKIAITYGTAANDVGYTRNGATPYTYATPVTMPTGINRVDFGSNATGGVVHSMFLQSFSYYNYRISNAQMQQVTT